MNVKSVKKDDRLSLEGREKENHLIVQHLLQAKTVKFNSFSYSIFHTKPLKTLYSKR